jgi:NADH-quinone oxidoreductase subunit F
MDLHVIGPLASPLERAAVDSVLHPELGPPTGWAGGPRDIGTEGHAARGGHTARSRRDLLLPALHALQDRIGWISQPALSYVCRRLTVPPAEAYGVASFYALLSLEERPPHVAHVCDDIACRVAGAEALCADLERTLGPEGEPIDGADATWHRSPCLGLCDRAPAALFTVAGERPERYVTGPVDAVTVAHPPGGGSSFPDQWTRRPRLAGPLLSRVGTVDPTSIDDYVAHGGFRALARARSLGATGVIDAIATAGLVGRGGAAFPTGRKWAAVASAPALPHYFVCNADESEPGTFKDRVLMEGDPFAVVEAIAIGAFAVGTRHAYLYVRGEYPLAEERMRSSIEQSTTAGHLGDLRIEVRRGAGAYICGEETALFSSIEGKRGEPRNKPPFPVDVGLFGKPTAVNNVETLANIPLILSGRPWSETKLFCLSGNVTRPGLYEVRFGATLRELIDLAGGVPGDRRIRAILLGGAAGTFVGPEALDTPLTFEGTRAIGATVGSGVVMVFDETADLVGALRRIARFFRDESCGQCVPCRVGTVRQEELLDRIAAGERDQVELLREVGQVMRDASICGLGQTASSAIESALRQPGVVSL